MCVFNLADLPNVEFVTNPQIISDLSGTLFGLLCTFYKFDSVASACIYAYQRT